MGNGAGDNSTRAKELHSNLDITDPHNPLIFSTVYRRYVIPVLRTEYVIWK